MRRSMTWIAIALLLPSIVPSIVAASVGNAAVTDTAAVTGAVTGAVAPNQSSNKPHSQSCATRKVTTNDARPVIGLVLSGGGARGAAHVGVLRVLEEYGIPVDIVVGTSMGSIIGALYASGWPVDDIEKIVNDTDWNAVLDDGPPFVDYSTVRKREMRAYSLGGRLGIGSKGIKLASGFREGQNIGLMLRDLTRHVSDITCFRDLAVPFAAVATDAETGEEVVLDHGDIVKALRASMALPGYFSPVDIDGRLLVDGGVANNMPVSLAREMGADIVIAVDIGTPMASRDQLRSMFSVSQQMSVMLARRGADRERRSLHDRDVLIIPELSDIKTLDFPEMPAAVKAGEQAARLDLLNFPERNQEQAGQLPAARFAEKLADSHQATRLHHVHVTGDVIVPEEQILNRLGLAEGDRLYRSKIDRAITRIYGLDYYSTIDYRREPRADGTEDLVVMPVGRTTGPNYIQFGLGMYDNFEGTNEFVLGASLATTELNRLTGQLLLQFQLGATQMLHAELYQPITGSGHVFVAPGLLSESHNLDVYAGANPYARYQVSTHTMSLDIGWAHRTGEWRIGYGRGEQRLNRLIGVPAFLNFDSDLGYLHVRAEFDNQDRRDFPRTGIRAEFDAAFGDQSLGATDKYDAGHLTAEFAGSAGAQTWVFGLHGASQHTHGSMALEPVTLGGPLLMSAFSRDELVGEQAAMVRLGTYRQFNRLNWLQAYAGASLEYGGAWSGDISDMRSDDLWPVAAAYLGMTTPLGPVMLVGGISEQGHRALQFQLGYRF